MNAGSDLLNDIDIKDLLNGREVEINQVEKSNGFKFAKSTVTVNGNKIDISANQNYSDIQSMLESNDINHDLISEELTASEIDTKLLKIKQVESSETHTNSDLNYISRLKDI